MARRLYKHDMETAKDIICDLIYRRETDVRQVTYRKDIAFGLRYNPKEVLTTQQVKYINDYYKQYGLEILKVDKNKVLFGIVGLI